MTEVTGGGVHNTDDVPKEIRWTFFCLLAGLFAWFAFKIRQGGKWIRIGVSIVLILATVGTLYSVATGPIGLEKILNGISLLLKLAVIGLLWFPQPSHTHFAG